MSGMQLLERIHELHPGTGSSSSRPFPRWNSRCRPSRRALSLPVQAFPRDGLLIALDRYFRFLDLKRENARLRGEQGEDEFIGRARPC